MELWIFILGILCLIVAFIFYQFAPEPNNQLGSILEAIIFFTCAFIGLILILCSSLLWLIS